MSRTAEALALVALDGLMKRTTGVPELTVGIIDGPVDTGHPDLASAGIRSIGQGRPVACSATDSFACFHGTFVAGVLAAPRGADAPALCPGCTIVARPIFCEASDPRHCPIVTPEHLAEAIEEMIDAGARIINLSLGAESTATTTNRVLNDAVERARDRGVLLVIAAGNHGRVGDNRLFSHPWLIPVAGCDAAGRPLASTNIGVAIGTRGLMAPARGITSTIPGARYATMTGTSVAAPLVTGAAALLWSLAPGTSAAGIRAALVRRGARRSSIVPPLLDGSTSLALLQSSTVHPHT